MSICPYLFVFASSILLTPIEGPAAAGRPTHPRSLDRRRSYRQWNQMTSSWRQSVPAARRPVLTGIPVGIHGAWCVAFDIRRTESARNTVISTTKCLLLRQLLYVFIHRRTQTVETITPAQSHWRTVRIWPMLLTDHWWAIDPKINDLGQPWTAVPRILAHKLCVFRSSPQQFERRCTHAVSNVNDAKNYTCSSGIGSRPAFPRPLSK